jgi:hypothetical protein
MWIMAKKKLKNTTPDTRRSVRRDPDLALDGWLMKAAEDPRVSKVVVFKRTPDERWKRVHPKWDLYPPFDFAPDPDPIFREYGDGGYRFVAVIQGKFGGTYTEEVGGYGQPRRLGWNFPVMRRV